jgi:hypothetical protein
MQWSFDKEHGNVYWILLPVFLLFLQARCVQPTASRAALAADDDVVEDVDKSISRMTVGGRREFNNQESRCRHEIAFKQNHAAYFQSISDWNSIDP